MLELGDEDGDTLSLQLSATVKPVPFCNYKFLWSEMLIVSFPRKHLGWAQFRKDVIGFGTYDRYESNALHLNHLAVSAGTTFVMKTEVLLPTLQITIDSGGWTKLLDFAQGWCDRNPCRH